MSTQNFALSFVQSLLGQKITFKPIEKGKDRPVQTILFNEIVDLPISSGGTVPAFRTTLTFAGKRGVVQTTRDISIERALEYVGQAASSQEVYDEVIYVAPEPKPAKEKVVKEKPVKEAKEPKAKKEKKAKGEPADVFPDEGENVVEPADDENFGDPFAEDDEFGA